VQGKDFERPGVEGESKGSGFFTHNDPIERPAPRYTGTHTLHTGGQRASYLLLPILNA
jgi:hypothetical protein